MSDPVSREEFEQLVERVDDLEDELDEVTNELQEEREKRREAEVRAERAERVAHTAVAHSRELLEQRDAQENWNKNISGFVYETLQKRVSDLEHDRVDVSDLINSESETHDLEIQRKTAARLSAEREDKPSPLDGNKHRMTYLWRHFIENATKTKGGKLKLDSADCRTRLERYAGIHDPNTNTVQRAMKMLARHTRRDGGVSDPGKHGSDDNLVQFESGERGQQSAALVADEDEFREFCNDQARAVTMADTGSQEVTA